MYSKRDSDLCSALATMTLLCAAVAMIVHILPYLLIGGGIALAVGVAWWLLNHFSDDKKS